MEFSFIVCYCFLMTPNEIDKRVNDEIIIRAVANDNCPDCGGHLDYPRRMGMGSYLNQDQWEAVNSSKFCKKCNKCWCKQCMIDEKIGVEYDDGPSS